MCSKNKIIMRKLLIYINIFLFVHNILYITQKIIKCFDNKSNCQAIIVVRLFYIQRCSMVWHHRNSNWG